MFHRFRAGTRDPELQGAHTPEEFDHLLKFVGLDRILILREMGVCCGLRANVAAPAGGRVNGSLLELTREDSANLVAAMGGRT